MRPVATILVLIDHFRFCVSSEELYMLLCAKIICIKSTRLLAVELLPDTK